MTCLIGLLKAIVIILFASVCPNLAIAGNSQNEQRPCSQLRIFSLYQGNSAPLFQEATGTVIFWKPDQKSYVLTVAHAVDKSTALVGLCGTQIVEMSIVGIDSDRDIAILSTKNEIDMDLLKPIFNLPQGNITEALTKSRALKRVAPEAIQQRKFYGPGSEVEFPFTGALGDHRFQSLAIMHSFFQSNKIQTEPVRIAYREWKPAIEKEAGIYRFQNLSVINQVILARTWDTRYTNPFTLFRPYYMTVGVRPGMSGAPVFEYLDRNLVSRNNVLVGIVTKTKMFESVTLVIPSETIETSIQNILINREEYLDVKMGYAFDAKQGRLIPTLSLRKNRQIFVNTCDADFHETSDLRYAISDRTQSPNKSSPYLDSTDDIPSRSRANSPELVIEHKLIEEWVKNRGKIEDKLNLKEKNIHQKTIPLELRRGGGDWGEGGGTPADYPGYLYNPYFTESRYIPSQQCQQSGITDNNGTRYVGYKHDSKILPIRSLSHLAEIVQLGQFDEKNFVQSTDLESIKQEICSTYLALKPTSSKISLIMPRVPQDLKIALNKEAIQLPVGVLFSLPDRLDEANLSCDSNKNLSANINFGNFFDFSIESNKESSMLKLKLGQCEIQGQIAPDGFDYSLRAQTANIRFFLENDRKWALHISQISDSCGFRIDPRFQGAIRIELPIEMKR